MEQKSLMAAWDVSAIEKAQERTPHAETYQGAHHDQDYMDRWIGVGDHRNVCQRE
jgi:hypothetical protein